MIAGLQRLGFMLGGAIDRLDAQLRRWPIAGLALLLVVLFLGGSLLLGL
jgi:hypothetical protein